MRNLVLAHFQGDRPDAIAQPRPEMFSIRGETRLDAHLG